MTSINANWQVNMRSLNDCGKYLFNCPKISDVTFIFKNKTKKQQKIYSHSWILSMMSPIFYKSFKNNFEVRTEIPITDITYTVFLELLKFLYTSECNITQDNVYSLLNVSKKYLLKFLEEDCIKFVTSCLTVDNACQILTKAIKKGENLLKDKVIQYIGQRISSILKADSFLNIDKETLRVILNIDETGPITEVEIFTAVMKWSEHKCITNQMNVNSSNKRQCLRELVKLIRFPIMTAEEICQCIMQEKDLMTSDEKLSIFLSNITKQENEYGFSILNRKQYINNIQTELIRTYDNKQKTNPFQNLQKPNGKTKFTVNQPIFLTTIEVGVPKHSQNVLIQLIDDQNKSLHCETFLVNPKIKYVGQWLCLKQPVLLDANREYIIDINYENINCQFWCIDSKILPWSIIEKSVEFKFTELNQLLLQMQFKPLDFY